MKKNSWFICLAILTALLYGCIDSNDSPCPRVTYHPNSGTGGSSFVVNGNNPYTILTDEKAGVHQNSDYFLKEWNTVPNGSGTSYRAGEQVKITEDITLYAQWNVHGILRYQIGYQGGKGSGFHEDNGIVPGSIYTVKGADETGMSLSEFTFEWWNTKIDGTGTTYLPGDTFIATSSLVLFAQWKITPPILFTVHYSGGLGEGDFSDLLIPKGSYTIKGATQTGVSLELFTLQSWNTKTDGTGTAYLPGEVIDLTANMILYAQWVFIP